MMCLSRAFVCFREEEGRRALMLEQEEGGVSDAGVRGMIELTAGSPGPSLSTATSGYSSCDDCSGPTSPTDVLPPGAGMGGKGDDPLADMVRILPKQAPRTPSAHSWLGDFDLSVFSDIGGGGGGGGGGLGGEDAQVVVANTDMRDLRDTRTVTNILASAASSPAAPAHPPALPAWDSGDMDPGVEMMDIDVDTDDHTDQRQLLVNMLNRGGGVMGGGSVLSGLSDMGGEGLSLPGGAVDLLPGGSCLGSLSLSLDSLPTDSVTDELAFRSMAQDAEESESLLRSIWDMDPMSALNMENLTDNLLNDVNMCTTAQPLVPRASSPVSCRPPPAATPPPPGAAELGTSELPPLLLQSPLRGAPSNDLPPPTPPGHHRDPSPSAMYRGLADHSYTNKTGPSPGYQHKAAKQCSSVLEIFLTTKSRINPQKGSDYIFAQESLANLNLGHQQQQQGGGGAGSGGHAGNGQNYNSNLLKQLLTGEIDRRGNRAGASPRGIRSSSDLVLDHPAHDLDYRPWSPPPPPPPSRRHSHRTSSTEVTYPPVHGLLQGSGARFTKV